MADIGSVSVAVVPSAKTFVADLKSQIGPGIRSLAISLGNDLASHIPEAIAKAIQQGLTVGTGPAREQGRRQGEVYGGAFGQTVKERLEAAFRSLPNADITADTSEIDARLATVRIQLEQLSKAKIGVDLDDKSAAAAIAKLRAELIDLQRGDASISVRINAKAATAELSKLETELGLVDTKAKNVGKGGGPQFNGLLTAAVALGPALIPIGAEAAAAAGALGLMGVAGALAFKGIQQSMKQGGEQGSQFSALVKTLKGDLTTLEATAAKNILNPFAQSVGRVQTLFPNLNSEIGVFSKLAGQAASNVLVGLIAGFHTLEPLFTQLGGGVVNLTAKFAAFAAGGGLQKFAAYAQQNLPQVEKTLQSVAQAILAVTGASASTGTVAAKALGYISDAINAIPVGVMEKLVPVLAAGYLAFQAYLKLSAVAATIRTVTTALKAYEAAQLTAAGVTEASAAAQATVSGGLGALASKYGSLALASAASVAVGAGVILINNKIADSFRATAASAGTAAKALAGVGQSGQISDQLLASFGDSSKSLNSVFENAFKESNFTKIKDFQFGLNNIIKTPFNSATSDSKNFFKSTDDGLTQLVALGNKAAAANAFKVLAADAKKQGVTVDQLLTKLPNYKNALDNLAASAAKPFKAGTTAILATAASYDTIGKSLQITSAQAQSYGAILGVTTDRVKAGVISQAALAQSISVVNEAERTGTASTTDYVAAVGTFAASAGTAADRAALIGAALKHANGDLLGYSASMAGAATANQTLVSGFDKAQKGAVNLKTGLIDYRNAASGPLIQNLQALQTAAVAAAGATFQHERATQGAAKASADAADQYQAQTSGALIAEAKQLGLTSGQAQALAKQYFSLPKNVKTQIEAIGTDPVVNVLNKIGALLAHITGQKWTSTVDVNDQASSKIVSVKRELEGLTNKTVTLTTISTHADKTVSVSSVRAAKADGGYIVGPGTGTSDSINARLSNGEFVVKASQTAKHRGLLESINKGFARGGLVNGLPGFAAGGFVNVIGGPNDPSGPAAKAAASAATKAQESAAKKVEAAAKKASNAAAVLAKAQANIRFTTSLDVSGLVKASQGSASQIGTIFRKLITDVHTAASKGIGTDTFITTLKRDNKELQDAANVRASLVKKISAATDRLKAARDAYNSEKSTVASAVSGNFDITNLSSGPSQFGTANPALVIKQFQVEAQQATTFAAQLVKLKALGLNKNLIAQEAAAGVSGAGASVASLATASKAQIAQINHLSAVSNKAGNAAGTQVANSLYESGVNSAEGYLKGLDAKLTKVDAAGVKLAKRLVKAIDRELGIKSPSTVMRKRGQFSGDGLALGLEDRMSHVARSGARLAGAVVQPANGNVRGGNGGGVTQNNYFNQPLDEQALALAAARRLAARAA